jgi:hypothetical protein
MNIKLLFVFVVLSHLSLHAQMNWPIIKANSLDLTLKDGVQTIPGILVPKAKPDIYNVAFPRKGNTITFYTDLDSISFKTELGKKYNFIVVYQEKDSCWIQIDSEIHTPFQRIVVNKQSDTIPFSLIQDRIYLEGRINNSNLVKIQYDLGASASNINHNSLDKMPIEFDGTTTLFNSDGIHSAPTSGKNSISIGNCTWENQFVVSTKNMERWEDVIVGNSLFLDKIVEIDYDKNLFIVHDQMPFVDTSYHRFDMLLDNGIRPMITATIHADKHVSSDWYVFDTGSSANGFIAKSTTSKPEIYRAITKIMGIGDKRIGVVPAITIGDQTFKNLIMTVEKPSSKSSGWHKSNLGNAVLNHYNVIIDNQNGYLYLRANARSHLPLSTGAGVAKKTGLMVGGLALIGLVIWQIMRRG